MQEWAALPQMRSLRELVNDHTQIVLVTVVTVVKVEQINR